MSDRYPISPFPEGWFRVAWSHELGLRGVLSRRWCGRDVVVFRGESGVARMLDAYCPHVGAHLGHGGRVVGETLECPFHGWRLDGSGSCVHVPRVKKVPPRARVASYAVCEVSGAILAYAHPDNAAPRWTPAPLHGWGDAAWTKPRILAPWHVNSHVQEFGENGVDLSHVVMLHRHVTRAAHTLSIHADGPRFRHLSHQDYAVFGPMEWLGRKVHGTLEISLDGFGRIFAHGVVDAGIQLENHIVFYPTPTDEEKVELHGAVYFKRHRSRVLTQLLFLKAVREAKKTIDQDAPIWRYKRFVPRPLFVQGEEAMGRYRRWARQFYAPQDRVGDAEAVESADVEARSP